jgi:hypothetical protein
VFCIANPRAKLPGKKTLDPVGRRGKKQRGKDKRKIDLSLLLCFLHLCFLFYG